MAGLIRRLSHRQGWVAVALLMLSAAGLFAQDEAKPEAVAGEEDVASLSAMPVQMISDWPEWRLKILAGDDALQLGLPGLAEGFYRGVLENNPDLNEEAKALLQVKLASALIAQRRFAEAGEALPPEQGTIAQAVVLRRAILSYHDGNLANASTLLARIDPEDLSLADQPWYYLLHGMEARARDDQVASSTALEEALERSVSPAQTAQIEAVILKGVVMTGQNDEETLKVLQRRVEDTRGTRAGFDFARQMAVVLDRMDRKDEAIAVLRDQMSMLTDQEKAEAGQMLLLIGLISGRDSARGQLAFREILGGKGETDTQRLALYLLAATATQPGDTREAFRRTLDELIAQQGHPLRDELLMMRGRLQLESGDPVAAEADARALIEGYPASPLVGEALWLRAYIAWKDGRYRSAAEALGQIRDKMPAGPARVRVGEQIGDVLFLKGDYAAAADMYSGVLSEKQVALFENMLFYQAILANTLAKRWDNARALLDAPGNDYPPDIRWRAEWIFLDGLREDGQAQAARDRLRRLMTSTPLPTDKDLRWRVEWLSARLAYDTGASEEAELEARALAGEVERALAEEEGWPVIGPEIVSHLRLLEGQAMIRSGKSEEGLAKLAKLREDYPGSDPAILSILEEARYFAGKFSDAEAQRRLRELADRYRDSPHAPAALYEAAILADRQGLESTRREAITILNDLITRYPDHPLVFRARLLQGNIARQLGDFGDARLVYETVLRDYADHPEIYLAQLYRANTLLARSGNDPALLDAAQNGLEGLDKPSVPIDVRVEAGYTLSRIQLQLNNPQRAAETLWLVISRYLRDPSAASELGANGKYWMSRCLLELGDIQEREGNVEDAREVYSLIGKYGLPGKNLATARREKLRQLAAAAPAQN